MRKIIKSGIYLLFAYLLLSNVIFAAETVVPVIKDSSAVSTIKDVTEKQKAEEEAFKELVEAPVSGPYKVCFAMN